MYDHILQLVQERPWAVLPSVLITIRGLVAERMQGERLSRDEVAERVAAAQAAAGDRRGQQQAAGVAIIPLYGTLMPKGGLLTEMSGATSVQGFLANFRSALADTEVGSIVIDVDSPGGLTDLIPEAAAEIRNARGQKPIVAVANTLMASAAYWLASQADEIVASPSALVGSIGVYTAHDDLSAAYEQAGIKTTLISAGKYKTEGNDLGPLDEEAERHIQALVDEAYAMFTADVAKGRGVKASDVRSGYGQGRILTAAMAKAEGLVDRIDTLDATIGRMLKVKRAGRTAESSKRIVSVAAVSNSLPDDVFAGAEVTYEDGTVDRKWGFDQISDLVADMEQQNGIVEVPTPDPEPVPEPPSDRFAFERELYERRRPA